MSELLTLDTIRSEIFRIFKIIPTSRELGSYITFEIPVGNGTPYITIDSSGYHYVISERGTEYEHRTTSNAEELFYWVFENITNNIAQEYALYYPILGHSQKRTRFRNQIELLQKINPRFAERRKAEMVESLKKFPFSDGLPNDIDYKSTPNSASRYDSNTTISTTDFMFLKDDIEKDE